jgi:RNA polymerase sigma-70 factor (ECF subfamily)
MNDANSNSFPFFSMLRRDTADDAGTVSPSSSLAALSDEKLVEIFLSGNEEPFALLVERHLSLVYKFTYRYLRNGDDANDVTQETFIKAWKYLRKFDTSKKFTTWILTIAKNTALDFIKRKKPVLFSKIEEGDGDLDAFLAPYLEVPALPVDVIARDHIQADLEAALQEIAPSYRMVLSLRYNDHLKFREIADMLREPIDTVKSKHRRGLALLRRSLGSKMDEFRT